MSQNEGPSPAPRTVFRYVASYGADHRQMIAESAVGTVYRYRCGCQVAARYKSRTDCALSEGCVSRSPFPRNHTLIPGLARCIDANPPAEASNAGSLHPLWTWGRQVIRGHIV